MSAIDQLQIRNIENIICNIPEGEQSKPAIPSSVQLQNQNIDLSNIKVVDTRSLNTGLINISPKPKLIPRSIDHHMSTAVLTPIPSSNTATNEYISTDFLNKSEFLKRKILIENKNNDSDSDIEII